MKNGFLPVAVLAALVSACAPKAASEHKASALDGTGLAGGWAEDTAAADPPSETDESYCPDEYNRLLVPTRERDNPDYRTADQWWDYWKLRWSDASRHWDKPFPEAEIANCLDCLKERHFARCQQCRNWEERERWFRCHVTQDLRVVRNRLGAGVLFCGEATSFDSGCGRSRWKDGRPPESAD